MSSIFNLVALAMTSSLISLAVSSNELKQESLPSSIVLNDSIDSPLLGSSIGPFITTQGNVAVGEQEITFRLEPSSSIPVTIDKQSVVPGSQITFSGVFDGSGLMTLPMYSEEVGQASYEIVIEELYSDLDLIPTIKVNDISVIEGDSGSQLFDVAVTMDVPAGRSVSVDYITQDETAISVAGTAKSIAFDQFGNAFVSVVENPRGGNVALDAGFPKFYAQNGYPTGNQWSYLTNVVRWLTKEGKGNKVLLFGDKTVSVYSVKHNGGGDFRLGFTSWAQANGFDLTIKNSDDYGGYGNVTIPEDDLAQYAVVIVMSSESRYNTGALDSEGINNFSNFSKQGGGILLITDHEGFQSTANQIANLFNIRFFGNVNRSPVSVSYLREHYGDHEIWNGLSVVPAGGSEGNIDLTAVDIQFIDYLGTGGTINFNEGETEKSFQVQILGDTVAENDETFHVELSNPVNAQLNSQSNGLVTIQNND